MPLKKITTIPAAPSYQVQPPGFFARHDGTKVLQVGEITTVIQTRSKLIAADTREEVQAECERLKLTPLPKTNSEKAAELFGTLPAEVQFAFGPAFQAISALSSDAEKLKAINAITVPAELAAAKAELVAIFA